MTAGELKKHFGSRLQPPARVSHGGDENPDRELGLRESFCGGAFDVTFVLSRSQQVDRLTTVLINGTNQGTADFGACVLREYSDVYGSPLTLEVEGASVECTFVRGNTTIWVSVTGDDKVYIAYAMGVVYVDPPYIGATLQRRSRR
jgi:hypothetical protein